MNSPPDAGTLKDRKAREALIVELTPLKGSKTGELVARFALVIGRTPDVVEDD